MKFNRLKLVTVLGSVWLHLGACQEAPPPLATPKAAIESGYDLYQRLSCHGCHTLQGQGGGVGPFLDGVGSRLSRQEMATQLSTPRHRRSDSRMPSFAFVRPVEIQAILDYLQSLN